MHGFQGDRPCHGGAFFQERRQRDIYREQQAERKDVNPSVVQTGAKIISKGSLKSDQRPRIRKPGSLDVSLTNMATRIGIKFRTIAAPARVTFQQPRALTNTDTSQKSLLLMTMAAPQIRSLPLQHEHIVDVIIEPVGRQHRRFFRRLGFSLRCLRSFGHCAIMPFSNAGL